MIVIRYQHGFDVIEDDGWKSELWTAEFWDDDGFDDAYPEDAKYCQPRCLGTARVRHEHLLFLEVDPEHRRKGIATALLFACFQFWPGLYGLETCVDEQGEKLVESFQKAQEIGELEFVILKKAGPITVIGPNGVLNITEYADYLDMKPDFVKGIE